MQCASPRLWPTCLFVRNGSRDCPTYVGYAILLDHHLHCIVRLPRPGVLHRHRWSVKLGAPQCCQYHAPNCVVNSITIVESFVAISVASSDVKPSCPDNVRLRARHSSINSTAILSP